LNILKLYKLKKLIPFAQPEADKPLHAGEIYYLWEGLTAGNEMITVVETYLMNTEQGELHLLLQGLIKGIYLTRISPIEKILKAEGFTVPPRPATKTSMGRPGVGQEVKLNDEEIISNIIAWTQVSLFQNAKAIGACTRESVQKLFIDLLFKEMTGYSLIMDLGNSRHVFETPPPATAMENGLNMGEVFVLWEELGGRRLSVINAETLIASTDDQELTTMLKRMLNQIALTQLEQIENKLKEEGFTVPARPVRRLNQGPPGRVNKIKLSDDEFLGVLITAAQVAIAHHTRSYCVAIRKDIRNMFKDFISTEIEEYQKILQIAKERHTLDNPPLVTSKR
jgi:hypothetical protein